MSQVNLLPPELLAGQRTRRLATVVLGAGAGVLVLVIAFYLLQVSRLGSVNDEIDRQQAENAQLQSQIDQLREFQDLQEQAAAKQALLDTAFANEVSFSGMLMDVSRVIPTDAYLTSFSAQLTVATPAGEAETVGAPVAAGFIGEITTAGQAAGVDSLASWLTRLESVRGWVNPWLDAFTETAQNSRLYTFTSGVDLTSDAVTRRGREGIGG